MSDEDPTKPPTSVWMGLLGIVRAIVRSAVDWRVLVSFTWAWVAWVALLPAENRSEHSPTEIVDGIVTLITDGWLTWLGWIVAVTLLLIGWPSLRAQTRRLQRLGGKLAELQQAQNPDRVSSRDPAVSATANELISELTATPPGHPKVEVAPKSGTGKKRGKR